MNNKDAGLNIHMPLFGESIDLHFLDLVKVFSVFDETHIKQTHGAHLVLLPA